MSTTMDSGLCFLSVIGVILSTAAGVAASQDQDFGTANLHVEVSDIVSVLGYVGVAKGNGVLSKTGKTSHWMLSIYQLEGWRG